MKKFILIIIFLLSFGIANAQNLDILAVVNDDIITFYDLNKKLDLTISSSGMKNTIENRKKLSNQTLNILIDEKIKTQKAKELGIKLSDNEIANAVKIIEKNNNMANGELFKVSEKLNIPDDILLNQIKSDLYWIKLVQKEARNNIFVSENEIDNSLDYLKDNINKTRFLVREIFIPFNPEATKSELYKNLEEMVEEIKKVNRFELFARQFSASPTAMRGGNLGWVVEGQMESKLNNVIVNMNKEDVSKPIETEDGFYILQLLKKVVMKEGKLPSREEIKIKIKNKKLEMFAEKYLRDLRRSAVIEVKG